MRSPRPSAAKRLRWRTNCARRPALRLAVESLEDRRLLAVIQWDGGGDGQHWDDIANWSGDVLPGANDDVVIDMPAEVVTVVHRQNNTAVRSITSDENFLLQNGTLDISQSGNFNRDVTLDGGELTGSGDVSINGDIYWNAGTISGSGKITANAQINIAGPLTKTLLGRTIDNAGTLSWSGTGAVDAGQGATINNLLGGFIDLQGDASGTYLGGLPTTFNNQGSLIKTAGDGVAALDQINNTGLVEIRSGTLGTAAYFQEAGETILNFGDLASASDIYFDGGQLTGNGTVSAFSTEGLMTVFNAATVSPGQSAGAINVSAHFTQQAGGRLTAELGGVIPVAQYDQLLVQGLASLAGTLDVTLIDGFLPKAGDQFTLLSSGVGLVGQFDIVNLPALPIDLQWNLQIEASAKSVILAVEATPSVVWTGGGEDFQWNNPANWSTNQVPNGGENVLIDVPSIDVTIYHDAGNTTISQLMTNEQIVVRGGTFDLLADSVLNADLTISLDAAVDPDGGEVAIDDAIVRGPGKIINEAGGTLLLIGATVENDLVNQGEVVALGLGNHVQGGFANETDAVLALEGSELGDAELTFAGGWTNDGFIDLAGNFFSAVTLTLNVVGGPLVNRGTITTIGDGADDLHVLNLDLQNEKFFDALGHTQINGQITTTFDSEIVIVGSDAIGDTELSVSQPFTNHGIISLFDEASSAVNPTLSVANGPLTNASDGVIGAEAGTSAGARLINATIDNAGLIEALQNLIVDGPLNNTGSVLITDQLTVNDYQQTAGTTILDDGVLTSPVGVTVAGGELSGSGTVDGSLANVATVSVGQSAGQLIIDGTYFQGFSGQLQMEIGGLSPGDQHDLLQVNDFASLNGTLSVTLLDPFSPVVGDNFTLLTFGSVAGDFADVQLPTLAGQLSFEPTFTATTYELHTASTVAAGVTVSPLTPLLTGEDGTTAEVQFVLDRAPTANVVIGLSSSDTTEGVVVSVAGHAVQQLTFTPLNWHTPQTVVIGGEDDNVVDGNVAYTLNIATAASGDPLYNGLDVADLSLSNTDDDATGLSIDDVLVVEGQDNQTIAQFTVTLSTPSTEVVQVNYATLDGTAAAGQDYVAKTGTLTFAAGETEQTIDVTILGNQNDDPLLRTFVVNLSAPVGAQLGDSQGAATIIDDDVVVDEDAPDTVLDLTALFGNVPGVTFSVTDNTNPALFDSTNINGASLTLNYAADAFGSAEIEIIGSVGSTVIATDRLHVTVNPLNDSPTVTNPIADVSADISTSSSAFHLFDVFDDVDAADATLTYSVDVDASDPLFAAVEIDPATGVLTISYADDVQGQRDVTVTATDSSGASASDSLLINVDRPAARVTGAALSDADDDFGQDDDNTTTNRMPTLDVSMTGVGPVTVRVDADGDGQFDDGQMSVVLPGGETITQSLEVEIPIALGTSTLQIQLTDAAGGTNTMPLNITVDRLSPRALEVSATTVLDGTMPTGLQFEVLFDKELFAPGEGSTGFEAEAADNPANYRLHAVDADVDVSHLITGVTYQATASGGPRVVVDVMPNGPLAQERYRLTLLGSQIADVAGNTILGGDLTILTQFSPDPPTIEQVRAAKMPDGTAPDRVLIKYSDNVDLDAMRAADPANFRLQRLDGTGQVVETIAITGAEYLATADWTLLVTATPLNAGVYRATVFAPPGSNPTGVASEAGVLLDGDLDGTPGGDFVGVFTVDAPGAPGEFDEGVLNTVFAALDEFIVSGLEQIQQSVGALTSDIFLQRLLQEGHWAALASAGASSQVIAEAVNTRIAEVFLEARAAAYRHHGHLRDDFVIVWGNQLEFLWHDPNDDAGGQNATLGYSGDQLVTQIDGAKMVGDGPGDMTLAVIPVDLLGSLYSVEMVTVAGETVMPNLNYWLDLVGRDASNQGGVVYFGSNSDGSIALADIATNMATTQQVDLSHALGGFNPNLDSFHNHAIQAMEFAFGGLPDNTLIITFDPVDFELSDARGLTNTHIGGTNTDGILGSFYAGNGFTEMVVIPGAIADVYTLSLVGVGQRFRGSATFISGGIARTVPLQGLLGVSDSVRAVIDFGLSTPTFAPPVELAAQADSEGGLFTIPDPSSSTSSDTVGTFSESSGEALSIAGRVRGGGYKTEGMSGWLDWAFEKMGDGIDDVLDSIESKLKKEGDEEDEEDDEDSAASVFAPIISTPQSKKRRAALRRKPVIEDDSEFKTPAADDSDASPASADPSPESGAALDASQSLQAVDEAVEQLDLTRGGILAGGLVWGVIEGRAQRRTKHNRSTSRRDRHLGHDKSSNDRG